MSDKTMKVIRSAPRNCGKEYSQYVEMINTFHRKGGFKDIEITFKDCSEKAVAEEIIKILESNTRPNDGLIEAVAISEIKDKYGIED